MVYKTKRPIRWDGPGAKNLGEDEAHRGSSPKALRLSPLRSFSVNPSPAWAGFRTARWRRQAATVRTLHSRQRGCEEPERARRNRAAVPKSLANREWPSPARGPTGAADAGGKPDRRVAHAFHGKRCSTLPKNNQQPKANKSHRECQIN